MSDLISRQAAIDAFEKFIHELGINDEPYNYGEMALSAQNVPSVEPERKPGHWEYTQDDYDPGVGNWHCSECKYIVVKCLNRNAESRIPRYNYCSDCGCRMIKP